MLATLASLYDVRVVVLGYPNTWRLLFFGQLLCLYHTIFN